MQATSCGIYAHYVLNGTRSLEERPPDIKEIQSRHRRSRTRPALPDAEVPGGSSGFAYAAPFRHRSAYRSTVEDSVYIDADAIGLGIGRLLLMDLIERCMAL